MDEKKFLHKLQRGDPQAFEQVLRQYSAYVVTVIRNRSRRALTEQDIEEVAADVFVALWQSASTIQPGRMRQWLGQLARNKTIDRLRRSDLLVPLDDTMLQMDDTLWQSLAQKERDAVVSQALQALESKDQEIFFRYYDLCQTAQEIASCMDLNASTVRTRLSRGREKLKQILTKGGFLHEDEL